MGILSRLFGKTKSYDALVGELLRIDRSEGLIGDKSSPFDENGHHRRGREIGELLCCDGGKPLMLQVATAFELRGGRLDHLSWCWHMIRDKDGFTWLA
jgi:hypothetical protein